MFTGIIQKTAPIQNISSKEGVRVVRIPLPRGWKLKEGESVSVNGICSTVSKIAKSYFEVEYMPETISKTTAGLFGKGEVVNLEQSLIYGEKVHGHFVQGHIDTTAKVISVEKAKGKHLITISCPKSIKALVALHGSVSINGVSLTVARRTNTAFTVALVPHTLKTTTLGKLSKNDLVNVETDLFMRSLSAKTKYGKVAPHAKKRVQKGV